MANKERFVFGIIRNDEKFTSNLKLLDKRNCNFLLNCAPNDDGLKDDNVLKRHAEVEEKRIKN